MVINTTYRLAPWADALYACDGAWWDAERPVFAGLRFTQDKRAAEWGAEHVPSLDLPGLSLEPPTIHQGSNSGYQALNLAVLLGAKKIVLLGYDMAIRRGKRHWHGDHPGGLNNPGEERLGVWRRNFETTLPDLKRAGVEVINASRESALTCFPRQALEDVL